MDLATVTVVGELGFDWAIDGAQLAVDDGLKTAVIISLFTDRRATSSDTLPDTSSDRRGWFGDDYGGIEGDQIGSHLWLLAREKQTAETLERARRYALDSLAWLKTDGVVQSVAVQASWLRAGVLLLEIQIERADSTSARYRFEHFWGQSHGV